MSEQTPNLSLPLIQPAQAQKHVTHNEAIQILDVLTQLTVENTGLTDPPIGPAAGQRFIVGAGATGDWAGQDGRIAAFDGAGWLFVVPQTGWRAHDLATGGAVVFDGSNWAADGLASPAMIGVNASADATNRLTVSSDATLLTNDGAGHQLKINKAASSDTASLLFQSNYTGHAEMGLSGNEDFAIKVSPDGSTWANALVVDATTGAVDLPFTPLREMLVAPRTYYVDPALGDDTALGLSAGAGAFATIGKAIAEAMSIDAAGFDVVIQLADGTYSFGATIAMNQPFVGTGRLIIRGNVAAPDQVVLTTSDTLFSIQECGLKLEGLQVENNSNSAPALTVSDRGTLAISDVVFGAAGGHMALTNGALRIEGDYAISGNAKYHIRLAEASTARCSAQTISLNGTPGFSSTFIICAELSFAQLANLAFVGSATGRRYSVLANGYLDTGGGGTAYFPGDVAGTTGSGGRYG